MTTDPPVVIGLTTEVLDAPWYEGQRRYQLFTDYSACLRHAGAIPFLIPGDTPAADLPPLLQRLDGILMTGGDDFDLSRLGGPKPLETCKPIPAEQQTLNLALVRQACDLDMPLLGVCLGMQTLGIAHKGEFIQHLDEAEAHTKGVEHEVAVVPGTKTAAVLGSKSFTVRSFHHQALETAGPGLVASAWSSDGVLEAVERPDLRFAVAVQWHPERSPDSPQTQALFSGFVAAAASYREKQT
jgi:gamma-glutamyl-gamma-aminobutyrate hydrolase PuuD